MGALFIGVVLAFPYGLAGLYDEHAKPRFAALTRWMREARGMEPDLAPRTRPRPPAEPAAPVAAASTPAE
jgi:urea transport system permease protein